MESGESSTKKLAEIILGRPRGGSGAAVTGLPAVITAAPYICHAFFMQWEFGIPALLFGPIGDRAHNADEYVDSLPS